MSLIGSAIPLSPDGSRVFIPRDRIAPEPPLLGSIPDTPEGRKALFDWMWERFASAVEAKRPETERLKLCELYYSGFHYRTPAENRANVITNLCFSTVETVHPVMTEMRPRPEIAPREFTDPAVTLAQQAAAEWWMDTTEFDLANHLVCRDKLKYGWGLWYLAPGPDGVCRPRAGTVWSYYPQAGAIEEDAMEHLFIVGPEDVDYLRACYPGATVTADGIAGAGYDVLERPYQDAYGASGAYDTIESRVADTVRFDGESTPTGTAAMNPDGHASTRWNTAFVITMFVRDRSTREVLYAGDLGVRDEASEAGTYTYTPHPQRLKQDEPNSSNGWRMLRYTASGEYLDSRVLDECFDVPPFYIDRDYAQNGRFWPVGELDHIIPINRSINERKNLLNHSLRYETSPILTADMDTGIDFDRRSIGPGDVLKKVRGSQIQWLDFKGAQSGQFAMLQTDKMDLETISGVQDVSAGRTPGNVEAAAAIRNLQEAAQTRIRGKEVPQFIVLSRVVKAGLIATSRKANVAILSRGVGSVFKAIDPQALRYEFDVRFVQGSGSALGRAMRMDETLTLAEAGLLDPQSAIERLALPGGQQIMQRLQMAAAAAPPPGSTPVESTEAA